MNLQPPPGSCIEADYDEDGRPRLTWRQPFVLRDRLASYPWGTFLLLAGAVVVAVLNVSAELDRLPGRAQGKDWLTVLGNAVLPGLALGVGVLMFTSLFLVAVAVLLSRLCPRPRPERIAFGPRALTHEPCGFFPRWRKVRELPRDEIGTIRPERVAGMWRLTLDHGVDRLTVGLFLSEAELTWLADAVRSWVAGGEEVTPAVAFPPPPKGASIRIEPDELGNWRLSWLPRSGPTSRRFHQGCLAAVLCFVVGAMLLGAAHLVQFAGGLPKLFRVGIPAAIFAGVIAVLFLRIMVVVHRQMTGLARLLYGQLRQPPRPESITLTASGLHYEPGSSLLTRGAEAGPCQEVRLEAPEYGVQKLVLVRDGRPFDIGRCLRKPEREWLAEVLRHWLEGGGLSPAERAGQEGAAAGQCQ